MEYLYSAAKNYYSLSVYLKGAYSIDAAVALKADILQEWSGNLRHRRNSRRTFSEILQTDLKFHGIRNSYAFVVRVPFFVFD